MKEYKYKINGNNYNVSVGDLDDNKVEVLVNGVPYKVELEKKPEVAVQAVKRPAAAPRTATGEKIVAKPAPATGNGFTVKAPLPGTVLSIPVKVGDTVKASDPVIILEAMKMENSVNAGRDGRVASIVVNVGDAVLEGAPLVTIE